MLDFCLTLPYGLLLLIGGIIGAVNSGSAMSALVGGIFGLAQLAIGW